jgi:hypothetical protein
MGPQKPWHSGWEQLHAKRPAQQPPSHFGFLVALPLAIVRFKEMEMEMVDLYGEVGIERQLSVSYLMSAERAVLLSTAHRLHPAF